MLSALVLAAAVAYAHPEQLRNYYGSWEEWSRRPDLPVALVKSR